MKRINMKRTRRISAMLVWFIILTIPITSRMDAVSAVAAAPSQNEAIAVAFGPQLFLIKFADTQLFNGELPGALPPTVLFHAQVNGADPIAFIASGAESDRSTLQAAGLDVQVLDVDTVEKVYYFVDIANEAFGEGTLTALSAFGQVVYQNELVLLLALPAEKEALLWETLPLQGIALSALPADALTLQADEGESEVLLRSAPQTATVRPAEAAPPLPAIAALIAQLNESEVRQRDAELSGEWSIVVSGVNVTIKSRYTFAANIQYAEKYLYEAYQRLGYSVAYFNWSYGNYSGRNVIAELPGVQHPERIWLVGGHFDSISEMPYSNAPGADDNASGTALTLAIARLLRQQHFADTIRFVHFSGEEQGQWGSRAYARNRRALGEQILGYIDLDMVGWDGNGDRVMEIHTGYGPRSNALGTLFIAANERYRQGLVVELKSNTASRFSDHSPFWDNNYPSFLAIENFFYDAPRASDRLPWYHNTGDRLARINFDYSLRIGRTALALLTESAGLQTDSPTATPTNTKQPLPATDTPTVTPTPTATATSTPGPLGCENILLNGDWEGSGGWQYGSTPYSAGVVTDPVRSGQRALRLGIPSPVTNRLAHSSAFQRVTIPSTAQQVVLRYWEKSMGGSDGRDYREILLLTSNYSVLSIIERSTAAGNQQWVERSFDLTGQRGKTVIVYFNVYNNGLGSQQGNYIDDAVLLSCKVTANMLEATPIVTTTPTSAPADKHIFLPIINQ